MEANGVTQYPKVVFVAHSMGGLIAMQYLLTYGDARQRTPLLVMFATPQEGSQVTNILKSFPNPALAQMLPADSNPYLQELDDKWKELTERPKVICAYEKQATAGIMVVGFSSSTRFCDGASPAIDASHVTIVKPDRPTHDSVLVLVNALNKYLVGKQFDVKVAMPDFRKEQDHLVFVLKRPGKNEARLSNESEAPVRYTLTNADTLLLIWPDDTPRDIPARKTEKVGVAVGLGPVKPEYEFTIEIRDLPAQRVVVRIEDISRYRQAQVALMESVTRDLSEYVSANTKILQTSPDPKEVVVSAVHRLVAKRFEDVPESTQWVLSADLLVNANLPDLASATLKSARRVSSGIVNNLGARRLAAVAAKQSGMRNVFDDYAPMNLKPYETAPSEFMKLVVESKAEGGATELAKQFQNIPSLKASGLSLEADVLLARGESAQAKAVLEEARVLDNSPFIYERIEMIPSASNPYKTNPKLYEYDSKRMTDETKKKPADATLREDVWTATPKDLRGIDKRPTAPKGP